MIILSQPLQELESYWHELLAMCPNNHAMTPTHVEVSRNGNIRLKWICVTCGNEYFECRNINKVENQCCQLDMLAVVGENETAEPVVVHFVDKEGV